MTISIKILNAYPAIPLIGINPSKVHVWNGCTINGIQLVIATFLAIAKDWVVTSELVKSIKEYYTAIENIKALYIGIMERSPRFIMKWKM